MGDGTMIDFMNQSASLGHLTFSAGYVIFLSTAVGVLKK